MSPESDLASLAGLDGLIGATVVDGIPTLLAKREGPVSGGLVFRVGQGDEPLALGGVTHLVEHLALYRQNMADLHQNGQTAITWTLFHATGTPQEVVGFLSGVCASLRNLPLDRLETEKQILRTEAARKSGEAFRTMLLWRYGARGPGTAAYDEEGLARIAADDVLDWTRTWFTRDNAALFLTTDTLPDDLHLDLPGGRRMSVALPPETLPRKPAWFRGGSGGAVVDGIVPRSTAAVLFSQVASRLLFRQLRQEGGLSYTATCDYEPWTGDLARITAFADALADKQDAVVRRMIETLAGLRDGRIDQGDLDAARAVVQQPYELPELGAAMLPAVAINLLHGAEIQHPDKLRAEQDAVTVDDVATVARAWWGDALAQVPDDGLEWAGFAPAPAWSASAVPGRSYPHRTQRGVVLVVGDDGVSLRTPHGVATVRYSDCVLMAAYPDGGRRLVGLDGMRVLVEPTLYRGLRKTAAARIDPHVPPTVVQHLPARPDDEIPRPQKPPRGSWLARTTHKELGVLVLSLAAILTLVAVAVTTTVATQSAAETTLGTGDAVVCGVLAAVAIVAGVLLRRGRRR